MVRTVVTGNRAGTVMTGNQVGMVVSVRRVAMGNRESKEDQESQRVEDLSRY